MRKVEVTSVSLKATDFDLIKLYLRSKEGQFIEKIVHGIFSEPLATVSPHFQVGKGDTIFLNGLETIGNIGTNEFE